MLYSRAEKLSRQPYRYGGNRPFPENHVFLYMSELNTYLKLFISYLEIERGMSWHTLDAYRRDCGRFLGESVMICQRSRTSLIFSLPSASEDGVIRASSAASRPCAPSSSSC